MKKIGVAIHAFVGLCIISLFRQFRYISVPDGGKNGRALNLVQTIVVEPQSSDGRNNVNPAFTNATVKNLRTIVAKEAAATTATVPPTRPAGTPRLSNTTSLKEMGGLAKTYPTLGGEGHGSPSSLLKFDNSTACGLQQEVFMEKSLTLWFKDSVPLISSVVGIPNNVVVSTSNDTSGLSAAPLSGDGGAKTRTYHIQILTPHLKETRWFEPNTWFCNNHNNHNKYPATLLTGGRKLPDHPGPNPIRIVHCTLPSDETLEFLMSTTVSSRGIQPTYDLRLFVSCDQVRAKEEQFILQRQVQEKRNDTNNNIHTMHACAQFMGNFSRLALGEWIEYHYMVGFDHIWLYINEPWSLDYLPQRPYVTYIPNNYKLTPEHYPFFEQKVRIDHFFQKMQQNECLYRAKRMNIEWMTVHDTDEFIVLDDSEETKKQGNMPGSSLTSPTAAATSIKEFLALFVSSPAWNDKYGAVQLNSIPFGRNPKKEDMNVSLENRLLLDWTWRSNMSLAEYPIARYKVIVRPINVHYVNIHYIHSGKQPMLIPANVLRLHHYKNADKSVLQASKKLGLLQDSWFRQRYRDNITQMLWGERTYIPVGYHVTPRNFTSGL
jgi:Glycosyltransferase family 92